MSLIDTKYAEQDGQSIILRSQDCTPIADWAKAQQSAGFVGSAEMKHAARIPMIKIEEYMTATGISFAEFMAEECHIRRIVQNPENADFRIWRGQLGR